MAEVRKKQNLRSTLERGAAKAESTSELSSYVSGQSSIELMRFLALMFPSLKGINCRK
jgi:hypothetical protein